MNKNKIKPIILFAVFLLGLLLTPIKNANASNPFTDFLKKGTHTNKNFNKSFGGSAGGKFTGNAYLDLDALPPHGKAGVYAEGSVFIKDVHTWKVIKAEGFIEGGLNVKPGFDGKTGELVITFTAGADAIMDIDFLSRQIYYYSANKARAARGKKPITKSWQARFKIKPLDSVLAKTGATLGIGKEGAFQLLSDSVMETIRVLIKTTVKKNGKELTPDEKFKQISKLIADQLYKIANLALDKKVKDEVARLIKNNHDPDAMIQALTKGKGSGELGRLAGFKKKKKAIHVLYKAVNLLLTFDYKALANGTKVGLDKEYKWEKNLPGYSQSMIVGIVPITIEFGGSAGVGARWEVGVTMASASNPKSQFYINIGPFADAGAYASAAINLLLFKGGVEGTIDLIRDDLTLAVKAPFPKIWTNMTGTITNKLSTLNGDMGVFISWTELRFYKKRVCKKRYKWTSWKATRRKYRRVPYRARVKRWRLRRWRLRSYYTYVTKYRKQYYNQSYTKRGLRRVYGCKYDTKLGWVPQKRSKTIFHFKGPSYNTSFPLFKFSYAGNKALDFVADEFMADMF